MFKTCNEHNIFQTYLNFMQYFPMAKEIEYNNKGERLS